MTGRAKIGFGNDLGDLSSFTPAPTKQQRRHRTGRSAQINIKAKPETIEAFTAWADAQGLSIAEAFEVVIGRLSDS